MILKLELDGNKHLALIQALQSEANHYPNPDKNANPKHLPFARVISDEVDNRASPHVVAMFALPNRKVVLEVEESFTYEEKRAAVPRAALDNIFEAVDLYSTRIRMR